MNNWRPTKGKLLGEIIGGEYTSPGGIIVVDVKKKKPRKVRILAVGGPGKQFIQVTKEGIIPAPSDYPLFVNDKGELEEYRAKPGQTAYFKLAAGKPFKIGGKECLILNNEDIVAVEA